MIGKKFDPCPVCWSDVKINGMEIVCTDNVCLYRSNILHHDEICAALKYYREHKGRRCENCIKYVKSHSGYICKPISIVRKKDFYCTDWAANNIRTKMIICNICGKKYISGTMCGCAYGYGK